MGNENEKRMMVEGREIICDGGELRWADADNGKLVGVTKGDLKMVLQLPDECPYGFEVRGTPEMRRRFAEAAMAKEMAEFAMIFPSILDSLEFSALSFANALTSAGQLAAAKERMRVMGEIREQLRKIGVVLP